MTIRDLLNKKKRLSSIISYAGMAIFFADMIFGPWKYEFPVLGLIGFGVAFLSGSFLFLGLRCPNCERQWGAIAMSSWHPFAISKKIRFCLYCGIDIDNEFHKSNDI